MPCVSAPWPRWHLPLELKSELGAHAVLSARMTAAEMTPRAERVRAGRDPGVAAEADWRRSVCPLTPLRLAVAHEISNHSAQSSVVSTWKVLSFVLSCQQFMSIQE